MRQVWTRHGRRKAGIISAAIENEQTYDVIAPRLLVSVYLTFIANKPLHPEGMFDPDSRNVMCNWAQWAKMTHLTKFYENI
jgi:hypothetical protein